MDDIEKENVKQLDQSTASIVNEVIQSNDGQDIKRLTQLFNINQAKKNFIRVDALNKLIDSVTEQMAERLEKRSGEFTNTELLNYMQTLQTAVEKSTKTINMDNTPMIQLNQVNLDVEQPKIDRESRNRITDAVQKILKRLQQEQQEPEIIIEDNEQPINNDVNSLELLNNEEEDNEANH